jgi:hypothetical protein
MTRPKFRSSHWFGKHDKDGFIHRGWMKNQGLPSNLFDGRPVIGICRVPGHASRSGRGLRLLARKERRCRAA